MAERPAPAAMTYTDAIEFLYGLRLFGAKFGLENTRKLADLAGNPHEQLRFIHVAGTNGKGSTCAMLESIYRNAGFRTALFTSPHLVNFSERLQINRHPIPESEVVRLVEGMIPLLKNFPRDHHPTFFETVTVMAARYFAEQNCDLVIWETGLGGRLDATNIVTPLASVITNIGIEHAEWLGDSIDKIAAEKSGIIKPTTPVVTSATPGEGLEVIRATAFERNAPLTEVTADRTASDLSKMELPLHGPHQRLNAALAVATIKVLNPQLPVSDTDIARGLKEVRWPGRMQQVKTRSGQLVLLDGAHNPPAAAALRSAFLEEFPGRSPTLIFGVFRDKDSAAMLHSLVPLAARVLLTPVQADRSENPENLVSVCRASNPGAEVIVCTSLSEALNAAATDPMLLISGSLYLIGEALQLLQLSDAGVIDEKPLNLWSGFGNPERPAP